ncbi:VOC family protein [Streptomyces sp. ISL-98]|uniref:VOC family protein n=1 Tax=Streptomyces sp. ISL-98 TaxID=2819192 RepID=UPI001BE562E8|nr:VOC family protein [Streptomyces sp. ISL-98]MBT2511249.1 VOC family protein [Streptomyces sp. ISL-98]
MTEPAIPRHTPGAPCWVSLMVHGLAATQDFYRALFGWEFRPGPGQLGPYVRAVLDGKEVAGIGQLPPDRHLPVAWTPYFATEDADVTAESIRSHGGTIGVGPLDADHAGRMAIGSDPSGAVFGIWQAAAHLGTAIAGTHGTPAWNELMTRETATVSKFYQAVFGYEVEPDASADPDDYLTLRLEGRPVAALRGVGKALPRDRGPHWMTYFEVEDTDASARTVQELGGHVLQAPEEGPNGRVATVADPEGAVFTIVRSTR